MLLSAHNAWGRFRLKDDVSPQPKSLLLHTSNLLMYLLLATSGNLRVYRRGCSVAPPQPPSHEVPRIAQPLKGGLVGWWGDPTRHPHM